jgi:DNA-binding NarL/FixJ family response regulator
VVGQASSGDEAIDKCENLHPDLVVLDVKLADDEDAFDICYRIKRLEIPKIPKVILITSFLELLDPIKAQAFGADSIIPKDANHNFLKASIERILGK